MVTEVVVAPRDSAVLSTRLKPSAARIVNAEKVALI